MKNMKKILSLIIVTLIVSIFFTGCGDTSSVKSSNAAANVPDKTANNSNTAVVSSASNTADNMNLPNRANRPTESAGMKSDSKFNVANFNKLEKGISYPEVVKVFGSEGKVISEYEFQGQKTVMYEWRGAGGSFAKIIFQDGKLFDKVQTGLY